jgi:thiazole/oxazole-forming peptide maturase SagD family component
MDVFKAGVTLLMRPNGEGVLVGANSVHEAPGLSFGVLSHALRASCRSENPCKAFCASLTRAGARPRDAGACWEALVSSSLMRRAGASHLWMDANEVRGTLVQAAARRPLRVSIAAPQPVSEKDSSWQMVLGRRGVWLGPVGDGCGTCLALQLVREHALPPDVARIASGEGSALIAWDPALEPRLATYLRRDSVHPSAPGRWLLSVWGQKRFSSLHVRPQLGCPQCHARVEARVARRGRSRDSATDARRALLGADLAYDEHTRASFRSRNVDGLPGIEASCIVAFQKEGRLGIGVERISQNGSGPTLDARRLIARAELIERVSCLLRRPDVRATALRQLDKPFLEPRWWPRYSRRQYAEGSFPYAPVSPGTPMHWISARNLARGTSMLVPQQMLLHWPSLDVPRVLSGTTNGAATHTVAHVALSNGILEVLERDAFARHWYLGLPPFCFSPSALGEDGLRASEWLERRGWTINLGWSSGGAAHVVYAVATLQRSAGPFEAGASVFASAASGMARRAALHALRELLYLLEGIREPRPVSLEQMQTSRAPQDAISLYLDPRMLPVVKWFVSGSVRDLPADLHHDRLQDLVSALGRLGVEPLAVDMSVPALRPFCVFQVIVPGALPLTFGHALLPRALPPLVGRPLKLARRWPSAAFVPRRGAINPYPLPLG